jgi:hypothetical protein
VEGSFSNSAAEIVIFKQRYITNEFSTFFIVGAGLDRRIAGSGGLALWLGVGLDGFGAGGHF